MLRISSFLLSAMLGVGAVLATDATANAQHRGGGSRGGGGHYSGGHYSGGHYSGYHHGSYPDGHHHGSSFFFGLGGYPYYYGGYPYSSYSRGYYDPSPPVIERYYESEPVPSVESSASNPSQIRVILPSAEATVWMDGRKTDGATDTHIFEFSNESPGKMYKHKITAAWERDGRVVKEERQIEMAGGKSMVVDFTRAAVKGAKAPAIPPEENP